MTKDEKSGKFEAHLLALAEITLKVGDRLELKNDALQACFATILISADRHGVFLEPVPVNTVTPVKEEFQTGPQGLAAAKAEVADQIPKNVTPEQSDGVARSELLKGIDNARNLLNKAGHTPPVTPKGVNKLIETKLGIEGGNLGSLDNDQLGQLLKIMTERLDELKGPPAKDVVAEEEDVAF